MIVMIIIIIIIIILITSKRIPPETHPFPTMADIDDLCNEISSLNLASKDNVPTLTMLMTGLAFADDTVWDNMRLQMCTQTNDEIIHGFAMNFLRALSNAVPDKTIAYFRVSVINKYLYGYVRFVIDDKYTHRVVINTHLDTFRDGIELREWCMFMERLVSEMKYGYSYLLRVMCELGPLHEDITTRANERARLNENF